MINLTKYLSQGTCSKTSDMEAADFGKVQDPDLNEIQQSTSDSFLDIREILNNLIANRNAFLSIYFVLSFLMFICRLM